jgi:hypothetical protein
MRRAFRFPFQGKKQKKVALAARRNGFHSIFECFDNGILQHLYHNWML